MVFLASCYRAHNSLCTGNKLSEDSRKYGVENTCTSGDILSRAALSYGRVRSQIEKERMNLMKALSTLVCIQSDV